MIWAFLVAMISVSLVSASLYAAPPKQKRITCNDGKQVTVVRKGANFTNADYQRACKDHGGYTAPAANPSSGTNTTNPIAGNDCGGVQTSIIKCPQTNKGTSVEDNAVWGLLLMAINILTGLIGLVAVGGIVYGAILYASAEDKSDQVSQAKQIITNVVIGLVMFALMYSLLNFLIPGGIFN